MSGEALPLPTLYESEREVIRLHLIEQGYSVLKAAKALGIAKETVYRKLHDYGWCLKDLKIRRELHKAEKRAAYFKALEEEMRLERIALEGLPVGRCDGVS